MDRKSLWICVLLFLLSLLIGYASYSWISIYVDNNDVIDSDDTLNDEEGTLTNGNNELGDNGNIDSDEENVNKPATEVYNKLIHYSGVSFDISSEVINFDNNEEYNNKLLTLVVDNIKLDGKEYTFSLKNHPQNCLLDYDYTKEGYNEFYINDKMIYRQNNQACYLERAYDITIIKGKYIGITFEGQGGNRMMVFDKDINLVDTVYFYKININKDGISFSQYVDDSGCVLNNYEYDIVDGEPIKIFKFKTNNSECDEHSGKGCNCAADNSKDIRFELKKDKEKIMINKLVLNFIGEKTGEASNNELAYKYILDMTMDGKKIESDIFKNKNNRVIWSSNCAASFEVLELDNYYILKSSIAVQTGGSYILVMDKEGNVLKSFEDVMIKIDESNLSIDVTDCASVELLQQCPVQTYKLADLKK